MSYVVEKNVPLPTRSSSDVKYPWNNMKEVGDSFFVPESEVPEGKKLADLRRTIYNAARKFGDKIGIKFESQVVTEESSYNGEKTVKTGVRTWVREIAEMERTPA